MKNKDSSGLYFYLAIALLLLFAFSYRYGLKVYAIEEKGKIATMQLTGKKKTSGKGNNNYYLYFTYEGKQYMNRTDKQSFNHLNTGDKLELKYLDNEYEVLERNQSVTFEKMFPPISLISGLILLGIFIRKKYVSRTDEKRLQARISKMKRSDKPRSFSNLKPASDSPKKTIRISVGKESDNRTKLPKRKD